MRICRETLRASYLLRLPNEMSAPIMNQATLAAIGQLGPREINGALVTAKPGRVRSRQRSEL